MKTFDQLHAELLERVASQDATSSTVTAVNAGVHQVGKKLIEEAAEAWMAAEYEGPDRTAEEISQLLYWAQVLMISAGVSLEDVYGKL